MDESGVDMGFDLTTALAVADPTAHYDTGIGDYDDEFEQALSLLSTSTKDLMYYELKSRAPDTG
ncbi:microphthalmia-associated transcription factor-like protein, partial [Lasius niger]